jgi:HEAT repeat protein
MAWPAVPAILDLVRDQDPGLRLMAAATLIEMNVQTRTAVGAFTEELRAKEAARRARAARMLGNLIEAEPIYGSFCWGPGPPPPVARPWLGKRVLPALVTAVRDPDPRVRQWAAWALGRVGRRGKAAVPALTALLQDEDDKVRETAAKALARIDPRLARAARR